MTRVKAWEPAADDAGGGADADIAEVSAASRTGAGLAIASGEVPDDSRLADDAEAGAGVADEPEAGVGTAVTDEVGLTDAFCDVGSERATLAPRLR